MIQKRFFTALLILMVIGGTAIADATTLQDLFDGDSITVGDKTFENWELLDETSFFGIFPDYSLIDVEPLTGISNAHGLEFVTNGQFTVFDIDFLDVNFAFDVSVNGPNQIYGNALEITGYDFFNSFGGAITVLETVTDASGGMLADKIAEVDNFFSIVNPYDYQEFFPQSFVHVEKNILIFGDDFGDTVSLDAFTQIFYQTPEPGSFILFSLGLLGYLGVRRRAQ